MPTMHLKFSPGDTVYMARQVSIRSACPLCNGIAPTGTLNDKEVAVVCAECYNRPYGKTTKLKVCSCTINLIEVEEGTGVIYRICDNEGGDQFWCSEDQILEHPPEAIPD
jgi:hypothetical protein